MNASPQIDFYILPDAGGRLLLACRLADKAYALGHSVYLLAEQRAAAEQMDDLLWTFKQHSFLPHALLGSEDQREPPSPVLVGWLGLAPPAAREVLINLTEQVPPLYREFARVIEVVDQDAAALRASRQRYRRYREDGLEPNSHKLGFD